uniref:RING-type E3 ubiquitin transferase n=1 Tax=Culicoides sonorensis TaxID=179676 RepID=A0A336LSW7_CULSO
MKTRNQEVLLNKFLNLNNESIDLNCAVCKEILNHPVTLPCAHNFCKNCLETSIKVLSQQCPCCRKRFSNWYRQAIKKNQLVNQVLWKQILENYGDLLEKNNEIPERFALSELNQNHQKLSQTGEIRKEYLKLIEQFEKEKLQKQEAEEKAPKNLILQLFNHKFKTPSQLIPKDCNTEDNMLVAGPSHVYQSCIGSRTQATSLINGRGSRTSVITISSTSSPSCSSSMSNNYSLLKNVAAAVSRGTEIIKQKVSSRIFSKKAIDQNFSNSPSLVFPTKTHKRSSSRRSDSVESHDSLKSEIKEFKPIRTAPTTPKKLTGEILRIPSVRPESVGSIGECPFSPSVSSLSPINTNLPGRRSAFSVVSSIVPITSTPKIVSNKLLPLKTSPPKRNTGNRKRKSSFSSTLSQKTTDNTAITVIHVPKTNKKRKLNPIDPIAGPSNVISKNHINVRVTRSTSLNKLNGFDSSHLNLNEQNILLQAVIEQEKLEKILEQERKDFEFAKKLQKKLNKAEPGKNRTEYGLRATRGKGKVNGLLQSKSINDLQKNENHNHMKPNEKVNKKQEKADENCQKLRRSSRKRH